MHSAAELGKLFEAYCGKQSFRSKPANLYEPFDYMLGLKSKRLRPVLTLMACELFGTSPSKALPQAFVVELFHNFTLIHDDIMDEAQLRRGAPTVHRKFGTTTAILSGDAMLVYAYRYLVISSARLVPQLITAFNECASKVCEGQQLDMNFEKLSRVSVKDYINMIELKTAALIVASLQLGALVAGAPSRSVKSLCEFGKELGITFQLQDDWLDAFGNPAETGKQQGGDILQGKKTLPIVYAMQQLMPGDRKSLIRYFESGKRDRVSRVLELLLGSGIAQETEAIIGKRFSRAMRSLDQIDVAEKKKEALRELAFSFLNRRY